MQGRWKNMNTQGTHSEGLVHVFTPLLAGEQSYIYDFQPDNVSNLQNVPVSLYKGV